MKREEFDSGRSIPVANSAPGRAQPVGWGQNNLLRQQDTFEGRDSGWTQIGDGVNELLRWRSRNSSPNENGARAIAERLNGLAVG
jgi:hypothetical protein